MDSDASGWLWLIIDTGMVAVLAAVLIYGSMMWRRRRSDRDEVAPELRSKSDLR
jgi:hypothetical protein